MRPVFVNKIIYKESTTRPPKFRWKAAGGAKETMSEERISDYDQVLERIEYDILSGSLKPRERLVEADLMSRYHASRGTIRKAFKDLESMQLIKHYPNRGVMVIELTRKEVEDIFYTRNLLESQCLELAVPRIDDATLDRIEAYRVEFEDAVRDYRLKDVILTNTRFHQTIFDVSGNQVMTDIIDQLRIRSHLWQQYMVGFPRGCSVGRGTHRDRRSVAPTGCGRFEVHQLPASLRRVSELYRGPDPVKHNPCTQL